MTDYSISRALPLALVVAACGGMVLACARRLGQRHKLLLADMNAAQLDAAVTQLGNEGISAQAVSCDVTNDTLVQAVTKFTAALGTSIVTGACGGSLANH